MSPGAGFKGPRDGSPAASAAGLQRLRDNRVTPSRDVSMLPALDHELRRVRQIERSAVGTANAWDSLLANAGLPGEMAARLRVVSFRAGVLTVRAADASTKYAMDRFLRGGGEAALARLTPTTLRRVKLVL